VHSGELSGALQAAGAWVAGATPFLGHRRSVREVFLALHGRGAEKRPNGS
jgi:hypothetical protein